MSIRQYADPFFLLIQFHYLRHAAVYPSRFEKRPLFAKRKSCAKIQRSKIFENFYLCLCFAVCPVRSHRQSFFLVAAIACHNHAENGDLIDKDRLHRIIFGLKPKMPILLVKPL